MKSAVQIKFHRSFDSTGCGIAFSNHDLIVFCTSIFNYQSVTLLCNFVFFGLFRFKCTVLCKVLLKSLVSSTKTKTEQHSSNPEKRRRRCFGSLLFLFIYLSIYSVSSPCFKFHLPIRFSIRCLIQ